jgi:hypothetical protein
MTATDPTFLGIVSSVSGASITVKLAESLASGLAIIHGHTYRVGQVGSFVRIPQGYQALYSYCVINCSGPLVADNTDIGRVFSRWLWR